MRSAARPPGEDATLTSAPCSVKTVEGGRVKPRNCTVTPVRELLVPSPLMLVPAGSCALYQAMTAEGAQEITQNRCTSAT